MASLARQFRQLSLLATLAIGFIGLVLSPQAGAAAAQTAPSPALTEGKHYTRLQMPQPALPTTPAGKVEVIEFFWYGCPHCAEFEPLLQSWVKTLPADVAFHKVPAIFRDSWVPAARLFYSLDALGVADQHHEAVFRAIVHQRVNLADEITLLDWVAERGIDRRTFSAAYYSPEVAAKVRRAAEMTQEYGFGGVPVLIVGGKYMPTLDSGTYDDMLRVVDGLIAKTRAELKK
jgi:thiol:disulfide interchange protein DsbA